MSLFGDAGDDLPEPFVTRQRLVARRAIGEEFKAIGFYLSDDHPLDDYGRAKAQGVLTMDEVTHGSQPAQWWQKWQALLRDVRNNKSAKGTDLPLVQLSDPTGAFE